MIGPADFARLFQAVRIEVNGEIRALEDTLPVVLEALVPDVHKALGAFIALIVVNCMILGRQEAFASKRPVGRALLDAVGTGIGFIFALFLMGAFREVLGNVVRPSTWGAFVLSGEWR